MPIEVKTKKQALEHRGELLCTVKYELFSKMKGNRPIDPKNRGNLHASMAKADIQELLPAIVNPSDFAVVGGQHRLDVRKEMNQPFHFIVAHRDLTIEEMRLINKVQKTWSLGDEISFHLQFENDNIVKLCNLAENWGIKPSLAHYIARQSNPLTVETVERFIFKQEDANLINAVMSEVKQFNLNTSLKTQSFMKAYTIVRVKAGFKFETCRAQFEKNSDYIKARAKYKQIGKELVYAYNKGLKTEEKIFTDGTEFEELERS